MPAEFTTTSTAAEGLHGEFERGRDGFLVADVGLCGDGLAPVGP